MPFRLQHVPASLNNPAFCFPPLKAALQKVCQLGLVSGRSSAPLSQNNCLGKVRVFTLKTARGRSRTRLLAQDDR